MAAYATDAGAPDRPAVRLRESDGLRIAGIAGASGLAGALFYRHSDALIAGLPAWVATGLLYAALIGLCAAVMYRFVPRFAPLLEYTAAMRLALACVAGVMPNFAVMLTSDPLLNATYIVSGGLLLQSAWQARAALRLRPAPALRSPAPGRP